jgi:hypothetical protein
MSNPRLVKAFLASSITELKDERLSMSALGDDISNLFSHDEIVVRIVKCENFHAGNVGPHDQEYIDRQLRGCDISLFVFKSTVGPYTRHEYDVARALQQKQKQEQKQVHGIIVCFLSVPDGEKDTSVTAFQQQLHQDIDNLLAQIPTVLADESQLVSTRIVEVMGLYQKADRWASKTDYDKEKYSDLLNDYAQFLDKYGMYYDAEAVFLRQIPLAEELYGQEHENTAASYNNK